MITIRIQLKDKGNGGMMMAVDQKGEDITPDEKEISHLFVEAIVTAADLAAKEPKLIGKEASRAAKEEGMMMWEPPTENDMATPDLSEIPVSQKN